jgi:hypothetical protein
MTNKEVTVNRWIVPDGYLPAKTAEPLESHEALCFLNTSEKEAHVTLIAYFEDREPLEGFQIVVPSKRTLHFRLDSTCNNKGEEIPKNTPYALEVRSDVELGVQHTRLDTRQANMALFTTMAERIE